ncbi:hypothetical protein KY338_02655 [Candidatus Woesearchaeota archaeon]|nr:hypothetical protein [Candidatus Woesearchaeota archaeon]MBW3005885.1 hypothetical protein [Candidatus Woesearchaeota archaeon]
MDPETYRKKIEEYQSKIQQLIEKIPKKYDVNLSAYHDCGYWRWGIMAFITPAGEKYSIDIEGFMCDVILWPTKFDPEATRVRQVYLELKKMIQTENDFKKIKEKFDKITGVAVAKAEDEMDKQGIEY